MKTITVTLTKSMLSPVSWLIRWMLPRSRFTLSQSSHGYIHDCDDPDKFYDAVLFSGVREVDRKTMLRGTTIVRTISFTVPNPEAGMEFVKNQVGKKYDLNGAVGLGLGVDRDWNEDDCWHCYELIAGTIKASGRDVFVNLSHITETALLALKP